MLIMHYQSTFDMGLCFNIYATLAYFIYILDMLENFVGSIQDNSLDMDYIFFDINNDI